MTPFAQATFAAAADLLGFSLDLLIRASLCAISSQRSLEAEVRERLGPVEVPGRLVVERERISKRLATLP